MAAVDRLARFLRSRQQSFAGGSLITIALNGVSMVMFLLGSLLVARALGPKQAGYLMWFITGTDTISRFADVFGIYYGNSYLIASGKRGEIDDAAITGTVLVYGLAVGVVVGILFGWFSPITRVAFYGFTEPAWPLLITLNILGLVVITQIRGLLWANKSFIWLGLLNVVKIGSYGILALVIAYPLNARIGSKVAIAQVISTWVCVTGLMALLMSRGIARPVPEYFRRCLGIGARGAGANWLSFLHLRADQYMVHTFLGPTALGLYGVAVWLGELITQVPAMLGMVLFPHVAAAQNQKQAFRATITWTLGVMGLVAVLILPLAFLTPIVVHLLYGDQFLGAVPLLRYYLPGVVVLSGLYLVNNHIAGLGYPMMYVVILAAALAINIGLNLFLLPRMGVAGASVSSSISYCFWFLFVGGYLIHRLRQDSTVAVLG